ncbi:MAG: hypothetical protein IPK08_17165 [Bacteroidetes bacterium]|nr:hypothetical protein [Bacteroidota bacterium]
MSIYEGKLSLIGAGEWQTKRSGGGWTKLTAFDIGDHSIRNVKLPDYLSNYLIPGEACQSPYFKRTKWKSN